MGQSLGKKKKRKFKTRVQLRHRLDENIKMCDNFKNDSAFNKKKRKAIKSGRTLGVHRALKVHGFRHSRFRILGHDNI